MSGRSLAMTSRRVPCPTCGAPRFEYCLRDGKMSERSHPARCAAARLEPSITPAQIEALHKLHRDETRYLEPIVRLSLLRLGFIASPDGSPGPLPGGGSRRRTRHPLTDAGRAVIGVVVEGEAS
jgi:hypothetical protein